MALEKLTLILFALTFCSNFVVGYKDCTPPWLADSNPYLATIKSNVLYRCPSIFGDPEKEYCCYGSDGDVECCNFQQYLNFRLICSIPVVIIGLLILSIIICISCFMCSSCYIHKCRRTGW